MNPELVIIVPSRGRPQQMREFLKQWKSTVKGRFVTAEAWREHRRTMLVTPPQAEC